MDRELDEELRFHLERETEENIRRGMNESEARLAAARNFGHLEGVREQTRAARGTSGLESLWQDVRYSLRVLHREYGFSLIVFITLALSLGANTLVFSLVNALLLKPLPYPQPEQLVMLWQDDARKNDHEGLISYANFIDWQSRNHVFQQMAILVGHGLKRSRNMRVDGSARIIGAAVSPDFFQVIGVTPRLGREFVPNDTQTSQPVIISDGLWQREFGGDAQVLGKVLSLGKEKLSVVGVMPPGFHFPVRAEYWVPIKVSEQMKTGFRMNVAFAAVGRLRAGVSLEQAQAEMNAIAQTMRAEYPRENEGIGINLIPLQKQTVGKVAPALTLSWLVVLGVLLIGCVNVASLRLARATTRQKEIALRLALGASRQRIVRLLLCEGIILCLSGGVAGLLLARFALKLLTTKAAMFLPRIEEIHLDNRAFLFTLVMTLLTLLLSSLMPALQSANVDLHSGLKINTRSGAGRQGLRLRQVLVISEIALTFVLLIAAGLLLRSYWQLQRVEMGFVADNLLMARVSVPPEKYKWGGPLENIYLQFAERLKSLPGVQSVGASTFILLAPLEKIPFLIENNSVAQNINADLSINQVSPDYFRTMGIPVISGREFTAHDVPDGTNVVIINKTMAARYWPNENAVGKRFKANDPSFPSPWFTIIGVVGDVHRDGPDQPVNIEAYFPGYDHSMDLAIRTQADALSLTNVVRRELLLIDPDVSIEQIRPMNDLLSGFIEERRFVMIVLNCFAALALLLAMVGIYGVLAYSVSQRMQEIGVRLALGAQAGDIARLVFGSGLRLTIWGIAVGVLASLGLTRLMSGLLYGISAIDPLAYVGVIVVFIITALVSCLLPVRRAQHVDPLETLKYE